MGTVKSKQHGFDSDIVTSSASHSDIKNIVIGSDTYALTRPEYNNYLRVLNKLNTSERFKNWENAAKEGAAVQLGVPRLVRNAYFNFEFKRALKIKLVIVEIDNKSTRELLSPMLNIVGKIPAFGLYHTALCIGSKVIEWNDSSLSVPRQWKSESAVLAIDLYTISNAEELNNILEKVCDKIAYWNANIMYSEFSNNCQKYTDELCAHLSIKLSFIGATADYIERLRKTGKCDAIYDISPELAEKLGREPGRIEFHTHEELDTFIQLIRNKAPLHFTTALGVSEEVLLKSYDRAFWFRHKKHSDNEACKPHNCPYGDPAFGSLDF
jgi:hypothetical protein